jgi:hypothetical protein
MSSQTAEQKRKEEKLEAIRSYHAPLIKDLGIDKKNFQMKSPKVVNGVRCVQLYDSEFLKKDGFYFELIHGGLEPIDPNRTVYRIQYNPNFREEYDEFKIVKYDEVKKEEKILIVYNVPLEEAIIVDPYSAAISKGSSIVIDDKEKSLKEYGNFKNNPVSLEDQPFSEMTIRDYMAIHTGKPVSLKGWLNALIKNTL